MSLNLFFMLLTLLTFSTLITTSLGMPKFKQETEAAPPYHEEPPPYEVNPHFGFRKYFEIRYEPLSVPYMDYVPDQTFY